MPPEDLNLILHYLEKQGFRPRVLTEDPLVLAIDLPELEAEGAIYREPSGNSRKKTA